MGKEPVVMFAYDGNNFQALMTEYKGLSTFADVSSWDERAKTEVDQIIIAIQEADRKSGEVSQKLDHAQKERAEKNFLTRMFSSQAAENALKKLIQQYGEYKTLLESMASQLQEAIDFTPNSAEEQKTLLRELKVRKKELQVEKREVAAAMKAVRTEARQLSADAGKGLLGYSPKSAAYERRHIRYSKESALRPHEDAKSAIDRQLIQVDRDILWAEKFT